MRNYEAGLNALADVTRTLIRAGIDEAADITWRAYGDPSVSVQLASREDVDRVGDANEWGPGRLNASGSLYYRSGTLFKAFSGAPS